MTNYPERTAIHRTKPSAPMKALFEKNLLEGSILDFGGGRGADYFFLKNQPVKTYDIYHYDPNFLILGDRIIQKKNDYLYSVKFDIILCTYVLNVLIPKERKRAIQNIHDRLAYDGVAYITVRTDKVDGTPYEDGVMTSKQTFQKIYTKESMMEELPDSEILCKTKGYLTCSLKNSTS